MKTCRHRLLCLTALALAPVLHAGDFTLGGAITTGAGPVSVQAADFNGDGKIDLVSANESDNNLTVFTNLGRATFLPAATLPVGSGPQCVLATDINGDGKPDLVAANGFDNTLTVYTNNGHGGFSLLGTLAVGSFPSSLAAADFNGDGRMDLACVNNSGNTVTLLTNRANQSFAISTNLPVGAGPQFVLAADLNGDNRPDLAVANYNDDTVTILTNNGSGRLLKASVQPTGLGPSALALIDVNGDGLPDLLVADSGDSIITVLTNGGRGQFGPAGVIPTDNGPQFLVAADLTGDGVSDLVVVHPYEDSVLTLGNDGHTALQRRSTLLIAPGSGPYAVTAADLNGDGRLDLITADAFNNTLTIATNSGPPFLKQSLVAGGFHASIHGFAGEAYALEFSTNLVNWTRLQAHLLNGPSWDFIDSAVANAPQRFYRTLKLQPIGITNTGYTPRVGFQLVVSPASGARYVVQASTNLVQWTPLQTNTGTNVGWSYSDAGATNLPRRFYRLAAP
ncbi:MAG TPA: VCBS repeat-containing protein [Verrucomicrobiae bacterium]|jgi:hypothetical protein|nr:VCBS repeat-containing protein [Verrucomicrobiae bacterium]